MVIDNFKRMIWMAFLTASLVSFTTTLYAADISVRKDLIKSADVNKSGKYTFAHCQSLTKKLFDPNSKKKKAIIIGDSMACDFLNGVLENNYLKNYQIQVRFIPYRCQPILEIDSGKYIDRKDQIYCANTDRADSLKHAKEEILEADVVIFAARWKPETAKALPRTINHLGLNPRQKVIVLGSKNFGKITVRRYIHMSNNELRALENDIGDAPIEINTILHKGFNGMNKVAFVDPIKLICGTDQTCPVFTDGLKLISYDGRHLTKYGARYVGKKLFQHSVLGKI